MKTRTLLGWMLMAMGPLMADENVVSIVNVDEGMISQFLQGEFILQCPEGGKLPFKFTINGEFLEAATAPASLQIQKTCYVRCEGTETFLFSADLRTWKEFSEFFTGDFKVSLGSENGEMVSGLMLELNQRRA